MILENYSYNLCNHFMMRQIRQTGKMKIPSDSIDQTLDIEPLLTVRNESQIDQMQFRHQTSNLLLSSEDNVMYDSTIKIR